jgi:hypothetical protein
MNYTNTNHVFTHPMLYLFCLILVIAGASHKSNFFLMQWANFIRPSQKKSLNYGGSQNRRFIREMKCLPLWPSYTDEKGRTLDKTYGIKARCYWEHPRGTHQEPDGNPLGTWKEHVGNKGKMKRVTPFMIFFKNHPGFEPLNVGLN